jgi:hypothetical protein
VLNPASKKHAPLPLLGALRAFAKSAQREPKNISGEPRLGDLLLHESAVTNSGSTMTSITFPFAGVVMTKFRKCVLPVLLLGLVAAKHADDEITLQSVPPVVVRTSPEAGAEDVDPATTEITVTFSKDMMDNTWSWSTASEKSFPEITARPHYKNDLQTCVLPVALKPDTTYAIWVNSQNFGNFKDADGKSAVPYLLVFKTKA